MWISVFKHHLPIGRIFEILRKKFCFPHSTSTCKFDHYYMLEKWYFLWTFCQNVDQFSPYLRSKYIKTIVCLTCRWILQKKSLFRITFFKVSPTCNSFFMLKKKQKKGHLFWFLSGKIPKKWKKHENFPNMWHKNDTKNQHFQEIFAQFYIANFECLLQ